MSDALTFRETLRGFLAEAPDHDAGVRAGRALGRAFAYHALVTIDTVAAFEADPEHPARLEGTVDYVPLGTGLPMDGGLVNLFVWREDGMRIIYRLPFRAGTDRFVLLGEKRLRRGAGRWQEMTTLFADLYRADEEGRAVGMPLARGILRVALRDALLLPLTFRSPGNSALRTAGAALRFLRFASRELRG